MLNRFSPVAVVACPLKALMLLSMAVKAALTTAPTCPKNLDFLAYWKNKFINIKSNQKKNRKRHLKTSVSDPFSFLRIRIRIQITDPDPMVRLNTDPIRIWIGIRIRIRNPEYLAHFWHLYTRCFTQCFGMDSTLIQAIKWVGKVPYPEMLQLCLHLWSCCDP